jgi:citrate synthase
LAAGWDRIRNGREPLASNDEMSHAANFLWLLHGAAPDSQTARDLDVCLTLHADHTFNASTFACREVVSTRAHMYAGVAAGIGALSGSLHGGANERVMRMLLEVDEELKAHESIEAWLRKHMDKGERIMGMGHAVYKTVDPRATVLKGMSERLGNRTGQEKWHRLLSQIEETANREFLSKGKETIKTNVDFYSGSVYHMMGIPIDLMTPIFAMSRIAGWCAHIIEEKFAEAQEKPALYRPQAEYVGDYCGPMGCVYTPVQERP